LFDASMMVHFRKRFPVEVINEINLYMHGVPAGMKGLEEIPEAEEASEEPAEEAHDPTTNKGKLLLDATCALADIRYPSDISLLNEARENLEDIAIHL